MKLEASDIVLRFVPLGKLLLHEEDDPYRVKRLEMELRREGRLRNPVIVAEHEAGYVVLDGATRTTALRAMGFRDVLVQIVDYEAESVKLDAWHHVIVGMAPNRLMSALADVDDLTLQPVDSEHACDMLISRDIVACVLLRNGQYLAVLAEGDSNRQANLLCEFVATYRGKAEVHRTVTVNLPALIDEYADLSAVIIFPQFTPAEITGIALNGDKVPMGITRHLIAGRALGLDIPLEKLTDQETLEEKNAWLDELIRKRLQSNKVRLYAEPVFIFDE